jgi:type II secretory pathway component PulJ
LHPPRPFTLIELLVAALAGAVLLAALLAALSGAWRLQEQSAAREKVETPRDAARQRLTRDLRYAVPPSGLLAGAFAALTEAVGDYRHDDVEWVTAIGASNSDDACGDLVSVHYYLNPGAASDVFALVRTETRHLLAVEAEEPEEVVILENVVSFAVDWYDGDTWQESWDSTANENQLPLAARVRVEFAVPAGGGAGPLDLIVALDMRTLSATEAAPP